MKKQVLLASALTLLSLPSLASNFYLLAELGKSTYDYDLDRDEELFSFEKDGKAFGVGAGYKFNEYLALEFAYREMGKVTNTLREDDPFSSDFIEFKQSFDIIAKQISLLGTYPLNDSFSLHGRIGYSDLNADLSYSFELDIEDEYEYESGYGSESEKATLLGFGASYSFTSNMSIRGDYSQYAEWDDLDLTVSSLSIGFIYQL